MNQKTDIIDNSGVENPRATGIISILNGLVGICLWKILYIFATSRSDPFGLNMLYFTIILPAFICCSCVSLWMFVDNIKLFKFGTIIKKRIWAGMCFILNIPAFFAGIFAIIFFLKNL